MNVAHNLESESVGEELTREPSHSGVRELARAPSIPPRPAPGSFTKAVKRTRKVEPVALEERKPAPPRPRSKKSVPPPLPPMREPECEPAWDASEETDATEWHDVSQFVSRPPLAAVTFEPPARRESETMLPPALRSPHAVAARTFLFFVGYLVTDTVAWVRGAVPAARAFVARLGLQWRRASDRAHAE